jgi:hypothetical protein
MKRSDDGMSFAQIANLAVREAGQFLDLNNPAIKPIMILGALSGLVIYGLYRVITEEGGQTTE